MNGESASDVNQSPCDTQTQSNLAYSPEEQSYHYLPNAGQASEGQQPSVYNSQPHGSPIYSSGYSSDSSRENLPQQARQRSITLTWSFQGGEFGAQRPSMPSPHPQDQNQPPWVPDQTSQLRPTGLPNRHPRPSISPIVASMCGNEGTQQQRAPGMRPLPRPRQTRLNSMGHSWESAASNQQGGMTRHTVANSPCP